MNGSLRVGGGVHARRFGDEVVLVDVRRGVYFSLNDVGSLVWNELAAGASIDGAIGAVVATFLVDETTAHADAYALVDELVSAGLLERADESR